MPKIRWEALPTRVKDHLMDRLRIREIDAMDMTALLVGEGPIPKTFLTRDQACTGEPP
jgi:hypothetical protein